MRRFKVRGHCQQKPSFLALLKSRSLIVKGCALKLRLAFGRRMGPFETGDLVGLDVSYGALTAVYEESKDARYYPPQLLRRKVKAGELGRKTGRGWYEYHPDGSRKES